MRFLNTIDVTAMFSADSYRLGILHENFLALNNIVSDDGNKFLTMFLNNIVFRFLVLLLFGAYVRRKIKSLIFLILFVCSIGWVHCRKNTVADKFISFYTRARPRI